MKYTKEEFKQVIKRFNEDKAKYNWMSLINVNANSGWKVFKEKIVSYPDYYEFNSAREFKYWLTNSERDDFIEERFCPICEDFIEVQACGFQGHYKAACEEHVEQIRKKNVEKGMIEKYGFRTPGKSKEVIEKMKRTNLERYGVEFPLQSKKIHEKTIETGNANGSYITGSLKGKETKKQLYGDENYNNSKQASQTRLNAPKELKDEIRRKIKNTLKERYGDENYNNRDKIKQTCMERYGATNPLAAKQFKQKIITNNKLSKIRNHTTQRELFDSTEKIYPNETTFKENFVNRMRKSKEENHTTTKELFDSKIVYKDGMTYKEKFVNRVRKTKEENHTTTKELFDSKIIYKDGLTYKENFISRMQKTKKENHTTPKELFNSKDVYENGLTYKENFAKKCYETKKLNKTFSKSKLEESLCAKLNDVYKDVKSQYRSSVYPFTCDFYIPDYDTYVELQGFPSHGGHPFDPNNQDDLNKVEEWKQKAKEINFKGKEKHQYETYIKVWTINDPLKRETAKKNNLNFLEIFPKEFDNDVDIIVSYIDSFILQKFQNCKKIKCNIDSVTEDWRNEEMFGITKGHCLDLCLSTPFPGTDKWAPDNPIWDCNVAGCVSPREGYHDPKYLIKAIDNLFWILNKSIGQERYIKFVEGQKRRMNRSEIDLVRVILNRFSIAKICPKVTALMPTKVLQILDQSGIDISCGVYAPMSGFGGIIEATKRWFESHGLDIEGKLEAYDINPDLCKYYGWTQRDALANKVKTDKVVIACPPFGLNTERWPGTPMERDDEFETNYFEFHDWCRLLKEYIDAPNYIFIGPEESGIRENKNINSGLFTKQFGIRWYPEYSV